MNQLTAAETSFLQSSYVPSLKLGGLVAQNAGLESVRVYPPIQPQGTAVAAKVRGPGFMPLAAYHTECREV